MLPQADEDFLAEAGLEHSVTVEAGAICVVFPGWSLPAGYTEASSDLMLRLNPGYPDVAPDMWWFCPPVQRADGAAIPATESQEQYLGRVWQRWSRHFNGGQWIAQQDTLQSFIAIVREELRRHAAPGVPV